MRFALDHPGHYAVMFDKPLYDTTDPELIAAEAAAATELQRGVATLDDQNAKADPEAAALAAWSLVHGFSTLWQHGAVPTAGDPLDQAERLARLLFEDGNLRS